MSESPDLHVLLIEDNPGDARLIEEMLHDAEELAQRVDHEKSNTGPPKLQTEQKLADGLEYAESNEPDVILLDLNLPDSTGLETVTAVVDTAEKSPIVVLTGVSDGDSGIQAIQRGAQDYLVKDEVTSALLVRTIHHAIERHEQERERQRRREQLETLNRLNRIGLDVTHAVIGISTREELEQQVCERLVESDAYRFAWIGTIDRGSREVTPRTAAGIEEGYLDDITITVDESETSEGPTGRAIRTGEIQVTQEIQSDPQYEPWHDEASERGYESSAAIPIVYEGLSYGVINVYAESPNAFSEPETTILARLGDVVGHAITAIERKNALLSDTVAELEFQATEMAEPLTSFSAQENCSIQFDRFVRGDETLLTYGSVRGVSQERFEDAVCEAEAISDVRFLTVGADEYEFELQVPAAIPLFEAVTNYGGRIQSASIDDGEFRFIVELPRSRDTRQMIEVVQEQRPEATCIAQRTKERTSGSDPHSVLETRLTEKQRDALEAAYFAGYFDWPRASTGEEVAERIGISPATFTQHLRAAEDKFFESVFEG